MSSEKFCLKWNDFQENIASFFHGLRIDQDFSDVTLVSEENAPVEAHRVILSACSPFFGSVLKKNKSSHPMIYMRGLKSKDLVAIVDFIYHGEARICQEDLDGFLAIAEELQLKGLTGSSDDQLKDEKGYNISHCQSQKLQKKPFMKQEQFSERNAALEEEFDNFNERINVDKSIAVPVESDKMVVKVDTNNDDLQTNIATMMERIYDEEGNRWKCMVCGKLGKDKSQIGRHVECHIKGASHPCNVCGKVSRSSNALQAHVSTYHKK